MCTRLRARLTLRPTLHHRSAEHPTFRLTAHAAIGLLVPGLHLIRPVALSHGPPKGYGGRGSEPRIQHHLLGGWPRTPCAPSGSEKEATVLCTRSPVG